MIKFEHTEVVGWEAAIRGMRNPKNSWDKSDSGYGCDDKICKTCGFKPDWCGNTPCFCIGPNDHDLMMRLRNAGTDHRKFMRMIVVYVDITAPLYWWKEFDTYKVGTVANSCSTMHKITDKEFTLDDFSHEHLTNEEITVTWDDQHYTDSFTDCLYDIVGMLNTARDAYFKVKTKPMKDESKRAELMKKYWWQMIQLLPSSYNQKRTVMLSYEVLANMFKSRGNHKLDEWGFDVIGWIKSLPHSELITGEVK